MNENIVQHFGDHLYLHVTSDALTATSNRPFPSSLQPLFQSEAKSEVLCYEDQFSFILKVELIAITKISHLDSLWKRDWGEVERAYWFGVSLNFNSPQRETCLQILHTSVMWTCIFEFIGWLRICRSFWDTRRSRTWGNYGWGLLIGDPSKGLFEERAWKERSNTRFSRWHAHAWNLAFSFL